MHELPQQVALQPCCSMQSRQQVWPTACLPCHKHIAGSVPVVQTDCQALHSHCVSWQVSHQLQAGPAVYLRWQHALLVQARCKQWLGRCFGQHCSEISAHGPTCAGMQGGT